MFDSFEAKADRSARKRMAVSTGVSVALYAGGGLLMVLLASRAEPMDEAPPIDVTFRAPPPPAPPAPPAPPPPPEVKVKKVDKPRVAAPLVVPKELPVEKAVESDQPLEVPAGGGGDGSGGLPAPSAAPAAPPPPVAPPPPPPAKKAPINLPENATPPVARDDNTAPEYPAQARANGVEGQVILKVVVTEDGVVGNIEVMRGDEPFVAAAIAAVKSWRYSPALVDGRPTSVFRIIKLPFRIKT